MVRVFFEHVLEYECSCWRPIRQLYVETAGKDMPNKVLASSTVTVNPSFVTVIVARCLIVSVRNMVWDRTHSRSQN